MNFINDIELVGFKPTLQTFCDKPEQKSLDGIVERDKLARIFPWGTNVDDLVAQGAGVYWCMNPQQDPHKRGIDNTCAWNCIGLDWDAHKENDVMSKAEADGQKLIVIDILEHWIEFPPTGILESKNGLHVYWFFEPIKLGTVAERYEANETYKQIIRGIERVDALRSEGDSISRVLRLEGSLHLKTPESPFKVVRVGGTGKLVDFEKFKAKYYVPPEKNQPRSYKPIDTDSIYHADVVNGLQILSGSSLVGGEEYEFENERSGKKQIIINGKRSGQWIDIANNAIGGHPGGEGSYNLVRWVKYYLPALSDAQIREELDVIILGKYPQVKPIQVTIQNVVPVISWIKSGFEYVDKSIKGFRSPGTYLIGGYEKSGKSTFLLNIAGNMILGGIKTGYIDSEMSREEVVNVLAISGTILSYEDVERDPKIAEKWVREHGDNFFYAGITDITNDRDQFDFGLAENKAKEFINKGAKVLIFDNLTTFSIVGTDKGWAILSSAMTTVINIAKKYGVLCLVVVHVKGQAIFTTSPNGLNKILKSNTPLKIFDESISIVQKPSGKDLYGGGAARSQLSGIIFVWRPYQMLSSQQLNQQGLFIFENFSKNQPKSDIRFLFEGAKKKFHELGDQISTLSGNSEGSTG